jgi:hypothetical protein
MSNKDNNTNIILSVSSALINGSNVDQNVIFSDDRGDGGSSGGNSKNYISKVNKGKKVTWTAVVNSNPGKSNPGDSVTVVAVLKKPNSLGGDDILEKDCYYQSGNLVEGKVKGDPNEGETENYLVVFSVTSNGQSSTTYIIDPKLQVQK